MRTLKIKTFLRASRFSKTVQSMFFIENFPHIAEAIVDAADPEGLLALRGVSHWLQYLADTRLLARLSHDVGTDTTTTMVKTSGRQVRVNLWDLRRKQLRHVRALDVDYGSYDERDPNAEVSDEEFMTTGARPEIAYVLPTLPNLDIIVCHGILHPVFRHTLKRQERRKPTLVLPASRRTGRGPRPEMGWEQCVRGGTFYPSRRIIIPFDTRPWEYWFELLIFDQPRTGTIELVLLPDATPHERSEQIIIRSLIECAVTMTADDGALALAAEGLDPLKMGRQFPAAQFTLVGLEYWDQICPWEGKATWEEKVRDGFRARTEEYLESAPRMKELQWKRLKFRTLEDWRKEDVTEEEWEIVSGVDLS